MVDVSAPKGRFEEKKVPKHILRNTAVKYSDIFREHCDPHNVDRDLCNIAILSDN